MLIGLGMPDEQCLLQTDRIYTYDVYYVVQDVHLEQITKVNDEMHNCAYSVRSKALNGLLVEP